MEEEFYPMPQFVQLEVSDVVGVAQWYKDALGFRSVFDGPVGPDGKPFIVHLRRDKYQDLLLVPLRPGQQAQPSPTLSINFQPGEVSVAALSQSAQKAGTARIEGPVERPWNVRELTVYDPDGNIIKFSERLDVNKTFDEVMDGMKPKN